MLRHPYLIYTTEFCCVTSQRNNVALLHYYVTSLRNNVALLLSFYVLP